LSLYDQKEIVVIQRDHIEDLWNGKEAMKNSFASL